MSNEQVGSDGASPSQDQDSKPIWQSRTIIGAFVTILALVAGFKNFKIDVGNLTDIIVQVAGLIGAALAIYGRIKATQPIKFMGATQPGGAFNPSAPVKKATLPGESGRVNWPTIWAIATLAVSWALLAFWFKHICAL